MTAFPNQPSEWREIVQEEGHAAMAAILTRDLEPNKF